MQHAARTLATESSIAYFLQLQAVLQEHVSCLQPQTQAWPGVHFAQQAFAFAHAQPVSQTQTACPHAHSIAESPGTSVMAT